MIITVTGQQLLWLDAAWAALSSAGLWLLIRWYAERRYYIGATVLVSMVVTLVCVASVAYSYSTFSGGALSSGLRLHWTTWESVVVLVSFLVWPFIMCAALAQILSRFSVVRQRVHFISFVSGVLIAVTCPFALLTAGCGLANICL